MTDATDDVDWYDGPTIPYNEHDFRIFKERPGIISTDACWVCISEGYLYTADTLEELVDVLNTEWKKARHLVG
jgi:acyl-ACP thioesterase